MTQILRNQSLATRFQILLKIAANQPNIQQKDIAKEIGITSQAVSDYVNKMEKDNWISSDGRSRYRITKEGVNWMLRSLRELNQYSVSAEKVLTNITVWPAITVKKVKKGQKVSLIMRDGLLYATDYTGNGASGITAGNANKNEDVGVMEIENIVTMDVEDLIVLEVPDIQRGGSVNVDIDKLKTSLGNNVLTGSIGIEALVALRRIGVEPQYRYGVPQAAIEAARSGISFVVVCNSGEVPSLLQKLNEEDIRYMLIDVKKKQ